MSDSIWKEISLGRKAKPKSESVPAVEPAAAADVAAAPKQSIWKKELGRKPKTPKAPKAAKAAKAAAAPKQSVWKKEVSFGRAKKQADDPVAKLAAAAAEAVAPDFSIVPEPVAPPTQLAEAVVAAQALEPEPAVEVAAVPVVEMPVEVAPAAEPAPPVEQAVAPAAEVVPAVEPVPVESWLAEPELPPAPVEAPMVVLHPPVAAADLPPLAVAAKQPFWKKELSFGRKPKAAAPAAVAAPAGVLSQEATELWPTPAKQPFWKKEVSLSRKAKAPRPPAEPKPAKAPRAKRSLELPKLSLPSLSLPQRSGGGGGRHQVKRLVGLKIGGSQLAAARVANNGAAELLQVARADLAPGVVVAGELRDPDTLSESLKAFFAANKLPRKNVRLGIASNRIGVRTFDIVGIDDPKQLENAIHFRAQETLPIPLDEAVLDYHVLEERVDDEGNSTKRVLLVVAYRELVDRYVAACKKSGITLSGIDLEAFALLRALSAPRAEAETSESALVAVAVGHERSTFAVSNGRVCEFTRVLEWGGASLNVAIARALDLAPSEAEGIKRAVSLVSTEVPEGISPEQYALAVSAVRTQVQVFARELVSSLQFYQNQPESLGIGEIVITGGTANLAGLAEELQRLIGVHVRVGDPLARLKITKKLAFDQPVGSLAVAIGLGIED